MSSTIKIKRGTRQAITDLAIKGGLSEGEPLLITDEGRMAVATGSNSFSATRKETETTATSLVTARNINGVPFNGTSNIVVPTTYDTGFTRITNPGGGVFTSTSSSSGAIFIKFPVTFLSTMVMLTIKVYDYSVNGSYEVHCGGYAYGIVPGQWINEFAYLIGNNSVSNNFTVRFGRATSDGFPIIYIGELTTTRNYPQVFITEVQCGYSGYSSGYLSGWQVGLETSAFQNVSAVVTSPKV